MLPRPPATFKGSRPALDAFRNPWFHGRHGETFIGEIVPRRRVVFPRSARAQAEDVMECVPGPFPELASAIQEHLDQGVRSAILQRTGQQWNANDFE